MQWETVIGLEVHTQLTTQSKIFSGASIAFGAEPNTQACQVDIALPGISGLALVEQVQQQAPPLLTLVISGHEENLYAQKALQAGAHGYLVKDGMAVHLIPAIRQILAGKRYLSPQLHL